MSPSSPSEKKEVREILAGIVTELIKYSGFPLLRRLSRFVIRTNELFPVNRKITIAPRTQRAHEYRTRPSSILRYGQVSRQIMKFAARAAQSRKTGNFMNLL